MIRGMNPRICLLSIFLTSCFLGAPGNGTTTDEQLWPIADPPPSSDPTSLKIIDLHLMARGGREALMGVDRIRRTGVLLEGQDDFAYIALFLAPDKARFEQSRFFIGRDYKTASGTDGTLVWQHEILPKKGIPLHPSGTEAHIIAFEARVPFLFLDPESSGNVFVYRGKERYARRPVYLVHGWLDSGMEVDLHFDAESFHLINYRIPFTIGSQEVLVDRTPLGMVRIENTWWESGYKLHIRNKQFRRVTYSESEWQIGVDESDFAEPVIKEFWLRQ